MLALLLFLLIFIPICWLYGRGLLRLAGVLTGVNHHAQNLSLVLLAGLVGMTTAASLLSLFIPLNGWALLILVLGATLVLWCEARSGDLQRGWQHIRSETLPWLGIILLLLVIFSILENGTHRPVNADTGIYHAQAIRWMESYSAVPGLGNLHSRFAYNSSWLVLNAAFSLAFLGLQSFRFVSAVLFLVAAYEFTRGAAGLLRGNASPANILRTLLLPISFYILGSQTSSPGTDLPVVLILWVLTVNCIERAGEGDRGLKAEDLVIILAAVFLLTVKLSAAPLLLLAAWAAVRFGGSRRVWAGMAILGLVILAPWLARNVILSGYLVYPFPALDVFNFDWKIPYALARREQEIILAWARLPKIDASLVLAMPHSQWLPVWFDDLTRNQKGMVLAAGFSPMAMLIEVFWFRTRRVLPDRALAAVMSIYLLILAGGVYWLLTAPDLRFGYGFVVLLFLFPLLLPLCGLDLRLGSLAGMARFALVTALVLYQMFFLLRSVEWRSLEERLVLPADYPHHASEPCTIENAVVLCANEVSYTQCWYNPFPCIPKPIDGVYLRGEDWSSGFRAAAPDN